MKSIAELTAQNGAVNQQAESRYTEVREPVDYGLRKAMAIKAAIARYEMTLEVATVQFHEELARIEMQCRKE